MQGLQLHLATYELRGKHVKGILRLSLDWILNGCNAHRMRELRVIKPDDRQIFRHAQQLSACFAENTNRHIIVGAQNSLWEFVPIL